MRQIHFLLNTTKKEGGTGRGCLVAAFYSAPVVVMMVVGEGKEL